MSSLVDKLSGTVGGVTDASASLTEAGPPISTSSLSWMARSLFKLKFVDPAFLDGAASLLLRGVSTTVVTAGAFGPTASGKSASTSAELLCPLKILESI